MIRHKVSRLVITMLVLFALLIPGSAAIAEGTETLGTPKISIDNGSGYVAAGTGLNPQSGTIDFEVPVDADGQIIQALLYWEGHAPCNNVAIGLPEDCLVGTDIRAGQNITVDGIAITGELIGGPTDFYHLPPAQWSLSYRAVITDLELVGPGSNSLAINGVSFDIDNPNHGFERGFANGASVVVIYDDGSSAEIEIRDGNDNAWARHEIEELRVTAPQTFDFAPESIDRTADLALLVGGVSNPEFSPEYRPNRIVVTIHDSENSEKVFQDPYPLFGAEGPTWDTWNVPITIPAGVSSLSVEIQSFEDKDLNPASLSWVAAALSVPLSPTTDGVGAGTPGYWMNHVENWPVDEIAVGGTKYSKDEAASTMRLPVRGDMSLLMYMHLVAAQLNVAAGAESSCVTDSIAAADAWMETNGPTGSNVGAGGPNSPWRVGEPIKNSLDEYNNGRLCAPPRDSLS
jgi:hypothetical protein